MGFEIPPKAVARIAEMSGPKAAAVAAGIPWCDSHDCPREEQPDGAFLCPRCVSAATAKAEPQPDALFGVTEDPQTGDVKILLPDPTEDRIGKFHAAAGVTERAAAVKTYPRTGTQRGLILDAIAASEDGLIDEELAAIPGITDTAHRTRRNELVVDGWIEDSGRVRLTASGTESIIWVLTAAALDSSNPLKGAR